MLKPCLQEKYNYTDKIEGINHNGLVKGSTNVEILEIFQKWYLITDFENKQTGMNEGLENLC